MTEGKGFRTGGRKGGVAVAVEKQGGEEEEGEGVAEGRGARGGGRRVQGVDWGGNTGRHGVEQAGEWGPQRNGEESTDEGGGGCNGDGG